MFNKVLVLSASAGAGHVRAAQAIERAFRKMNAAREIEHVDTLQHTNKVFRHLYSRLYLDMVNKTPTLLGWLYEYLDKPWKNERQRWIFDKLNTRPLIKLLQRHQPDIAVCTHFLPAEIMSYLKAKERLSTRQAIVVTDFDVHAMWLCRHYEHYFVALEETRVHLEALGVPADKITVSGIPIDPVFAEQKDKAAMRAKYGLDAGKTTILISAGGFGVGPVQHMIESLLQIRHPVQIVAICGRSAELKESLEKTAGDVGADGRNALKVVGFTTEMDEYMAASDLMVGKPGGLTTSEALAKALALVIVNPIPGQEERNSDHLLEEGAAIRCNNLPALAWKLDRLLGDPARLDALRANARRLARPRAAETIVATLLQRFGA